MKRVAVTVSTVNTALAQAGLDCQLVRGNGYFYFKGRAVQAAPSTSVMVYKVTQLTLAQWVSEAREMSDAADRRTTDARAHELEVQP